jgi:hypothetical protein
MQARLIACALALGAAEPAAAQQENCRSFSWSVGRPINLFDEPIPVVRDQQSLPKEGVFGLLLKPVADVIYPVAPERSDDGGRGAVVTIESLPAGRFQIALSEEAWVDAVQDNKRLPVLARQRIGECPGIRRSVEIEVQGEPLTLLVSGATVRRINIAVVRVWPFEWRW